MSDWKEESIAKYAELEAQKKVIEKEREGDDDVKTARSSVEVAADNLRAFEQVYDVKIKELNAQSEDIRIALQKDWDTDKKTFTCEAGNATIRTTKSICVSDKKSLIATLIKLDKLPGSIRSWDLTLLRTLKDVDLIPDNQAYYEERQNVVIKGASK